MAKARKRKVKVGKSRKKRAVTARKSVRRARRTAKKPARRRTGPARGKNTARKTTARKTTARKKTARKASARKTKGQAKSARRSGRKKKESTRNPRRAARPVQSDALRRVDEPNPDNPAAGAQDLHTPDPVHSEDGGVAEHPVHDSDVEDLRSSDYERMIDERSKGGFDTRDKYEVEREAGRKMRKPDEV